MVSAYDELPRTPANFVALSPLRYLERAAYIYPHQDAIIHGSRHISWRETYQRCCQFAHQLQALGIGKNDTVSALLPNIPARPAFPAAARAWPCPMRPPKAGWRAK